MIDYAQIPSPCYVVDEERLVRNLSVIRKVADAAGCRVIMALKAQALWRLFPLMRQYADGTTASSLGEALVAVRHFGGLTHTYAPVYTETDFPALLQCSSHITFNSLTQLRRFRPYCERLERPVSLGIRVNPMWSEVQTDLYNPCAEGSRLGVTPEALSEGLPEGVEGVHFHTLCESMDTDLEKTLDVVEKRFSKALDQAQWINMGGGHLITHENYDVSHLIEVLRAFRMRHPHLEVILEPGAAFVWRTGELVVTVEDVVVNSGVQTAMLNVSFACHMPDCLEMPYQPNIIGAIKDNDNAGGASDKFVYRYRMGGCSCLSGDYVGDWLFDHPLCVGERIVFEDMIHYTFVKTTMFNGVSHPAIALWREKEGLQILRAFSASEYEARMG